MGFFDRFASKKTNGSHVNPATSQATPAAPEAQPSQSAAPIPSQAPAPGASTVLPRLHVARQKLDSQDLPGALAIYDEVLASAGDRADVLVTISGDLGVTGHAKEIIEIVAPRYDAQRHGPATGFNLLQAYLTLRQPHQAQHVLDLLFALNRADLEMRLIGFSNAIADMMLMEGELADHTAQGGAAAEPKHINLVSISKPIWYYGLEEVENLLPQKNDKVRRLAFGQLGLPGLKALEAMQKEPEDELGRLSRAIPLWFAETFYFSQNYSAIAALGVFGKDSYALFPAEWTPENIRQLLESNASGLDYVFTGTIRQVNADYELVLRLWEVKKFRERKTFTVRWNPSNVNEALSSLHAQLRTFMEWSAYPAGQGLVYATPEKPREWVEAIGAATTLFLADKAVLPASHVASPDTTVAQIDSVAASSETASLNALTARARAARIGLTIPAELPALAATPAVEAARRTLAL